MLKTQRVYRPPQGYLHCLGGHFIHLDESSNLQLVLHFVMCTLSK